MPTIEASKRDLERLIGKKFSRTQLEEVLLFVKGELDWVRGDKLGIDIKDANRPDLWSAEGIARELRARLGVAPGLYTVPTKKGNVELIINDSVKKSRPLIVAAVVRGIAVSPDFIVQMVQLQEKVGLTFGRKRKETGIGLYDLDKITPPLYYKGYKPRELRFAPLEFNRDLDLDEILELHPKGKEYGHLIKEFEYYPIVEDSAGVVCSMPPIINSNYTGKVTEKTKNLFVEVTGWKEKYVNTALNVIVAALADRGGRVEQVKIRDKKKVFWTPSFAPKKIRVKTSYVQKLAGMNWSAAKIIRLLKRAGYDSYGKSTLTVKYPSYRQDILHPADAVEDAIISFGYNNIEPKKIDMATTGETLAETRYVDTVRDACIGVGLQEILTFMLSSKEIQAGKMNAPGSFAEIANPVSSNWSIFRRNILPGLLEFIAKNLHVSFPHRLFETGKVVIPDEKSETRVTEPNHLGIVLMHDKTNFTEIKSVFESIAQNMGWKTHTKELQHPSFIAGRTARITGRVSGVLGEVSPGVLKNFGIDIAVSACEIEY